MFVPTVTAHLQALRNLKNTRDKTIPIRQIEAMVGYLAFRFVFGEHDTQL